MSNNIASNQLEQWAECASLVKSPVTSNLASLLRSMAMLTDAELLALELPVIRNKVTVWDSSKHDYNDALDLPEGGSLYKLYGFGWVEGSVNSIDLTNSVAELKKNSNGSSWQATSQAEICRKAFPSIYK
jgi:hypothetical protein